MDNRKNSKILLNAILLIYLPCSVVSLNFLDPINWPKQIAILICIPLSIFQLSRVISLIDFRNKKLILLLLVSAALFLLSALMNSTTFMRTMWGTWGRNNGLITLFSLLVICFVFASISKVENSESVLIRALSIAFIPASLYGLLQTFGNDPLNWSAKGQVFSFFGNPNFASSALAISSIASIYSYWLFREYRVRYLYGFQSVASSIVVWNTKSIQGLVVMGIALALALYFLISKTRKINNSLLFFSFLFVGINVFVGFLGKGIFGDILFQYTMKLREFYWITGIRMGLSNPLFGIGVDSYGDFYRKFRTLKIAQTTSVDLTVDNAHNSIIQVFATLGLTGLMAYFLVLIPALLQLTRVLNQDSINVNERALATLFFSSFSISLISIDNIAIAIVNWSLIGYFLGKFLGISQVEESSNIRNNRSSRVSQGSMEARNSIITWVTFFAMLGISLSSSASDRKIIDIFNTPASKADRASIDQRWKSLNSLEDTNAFLQEAHYRYIIDGIQATDTWIIALKSAQNGLKKYPNDFLILDRAAVLSEKMGKFDLAEKYRKAQLDLDPRHALVWIYYARSQFELGKLSEALVSIDQSRKFDSLLDEKGREYRATLIARIED
jgi:O-antigen ligase